MTVEINLQRIREVLTTSKEREKKEALDITKKVIGQGHIIPAHTQIKDLFFQQIAAPHVKVINNSIETARSIIDMAMVTPDETLEMDAEVSQEEANDIVEAIVVQLKEVLRIYNL